MPHDRIDPAAVLTIARDSAGLFGWVHDHTRPVSYDGALRGPQGVLMDRQGNSLDRSLLLARLLQLAGNEVRVVGATLGPGGAESVAQLVAQAALQAPGGQSPAAGVDLEAQAARIASAILSIAGPIGPASAPNESTHYWVQFRDGTDWVNADPTLAAIGEVRPHNALRPVAVDPQTFHPAASEGLGHSVELRLIVERWEAGRLAESPLASVTFDPSGGVVSPLTFTFLPMNPTTGSAVPRRFGNGADLRAALLRETAWTVVLRDERGPWRLGPSFDESGVVGSMPRSLDNTGRLAAASSRVAGGFADALGGGEDPAPRSVLTALVAEYETRSASAPPKRIRRFVFDSIGPVARRSSGKTLPTPVWTEQQRVDRGVDLAGVHDSLIAFSGLAPDGYAYRFARRMVAAKEAIRALWAGSSDPDILEAANDGLSLRSLELFAAVRASSQRAHVTVAEPQIIRRVIRYVPQGAAELIVQVLGDLAWNRLAPVSGGAPSMVAIQGVLDTLQEAAITLGTDTGETTASLLNEAERQKVNITAVRDVNDATLDGFPAATKARMLLDLESGHVLVLPVRPVTIAGQPRAAWWRVHPASGHVVGAMDTGYLQSYVTWTTVTALIGGGAALHFHRLAISPQAHQAANHILKQMQNVSWAQWTNILRIAQEHLNRGLPFP
jgi:hypothetical protein